MTTFQPLRIASLSLLLALAGACATADSDGDLDSTQAEAASRAHLDLWESDGAWFFHVVAGNGEVMLSSEAYTSRTGALNGVLSVLDNGTLESRYRVAAGRDGQHYVSLRAANGRTIAITEGYASASNARRAVRSCVASLGSYVEAWRDETGARFEMFEGADRQFYVNLHARNGAIMLRSEGYATEAAALNGAFAAAEHGVVAAAYAILPAANGGYYVNLRAPNNEIVATSEIYATRAGAERARDAVIALLPTIELL